MKRICSLFFAALLCIGYGSVHAEDVQLGAGDALKISVFGNPDLSIDTKISEDGGITFPLIGDVKLSGLTTSEAEKKVAGLLSSGGFLRNPQVNVNVTNLQSQQVSILGQINRPGRYPLDGKRSVTDMIAMAGGVTADSADTVTLIRKKNGQANKEVINISDMVRSGDMTQNHLLLNNDVIFVDKAPKFYVFGEVQRPGAYRLERNMTVLQVLSAGGGLSPRGTARGVKIKRRDADGSFKMFDVNLDDMVQVDDVVYVRESLF